MKKEKRIPTIIGLAVLLIGVVAGVFLVQKDQVFSPRASIQKTPSQVRITNVTDNSFTASWITEEKTLGYVVWGSQGSSLDNTAQDKNSTNTDKSQLHYVEVKGLNPNTTYSFKLASDTTDNLYDNHGQPYEITTGSTLGSPTGSDTVYGTVLDESGIPASGAVVYLTMPNAQPISAQVRNNGNWVVSLSSIRTETLDDWIAYDLETTVLDLFVRGKEKKSSIVTTTGCARPLPTVNLGQTYDFRDLCEVEDTSKTSAQKTPTPTVTKSSEKSTTNTEKSFLDSSENQEATNSSDSKVTIDNPAYDGEKITTTKPEFRGTSKNTTKAPPGTVLTIKVQSPQTCTGTASLGEDGEWTWSPPEDCDLEPGEHTITLSYVDADGEEQTVKRSFVVAAGEDDDSLPAFEATPSSETVTPTPATPSATPTSTPRTSQPSTASGVPTSGVMTPTLLLSIFGIGLFLTGFIITKW